MKKIVIYMKDENYSKNLYKGLQDHFRNAYEVVLYGDDLGVKKDDDILYLTDFYPDQDFNFLLFSGEKGQDYIFKYQKITEIAKIIDEKIRGRGRFARTKLIGLVNYSLPIFQIKTEPILKKYSKMGRTLLISFNPYTSYETGVDQVGLEDLILSVKLKNDLGIEEMVNTGQDFDFINSCLDPFELWKLSEDEWDLLLNKIKKSTYNFVLYELNFSFQIPVLKILSNSNQIFFFNLKKLPEESFKKSLKDLKDKGYLKDNHISLQMHFDAGDFLVLEDGQDEKILEFINR